MNINEIIDLASNKIPYIDLIEKKTNLNKIYIVFIFFLLSYFFTYIFLGMDFIINLFGLFYPGYLSFKSLQTKETHDDTQWLTYWIVFSFINLCDFLYYIIPMYHLIKLFTIIWLFHKKTQGAKLVYKFYLEPFFIKNEKKIDENIDNFKKYLKNTIIEDSETSDEEEKKKN